METPTLSIRIVSPKVIEIRAVVCGKVYTREYLGYKQQDAVKHFEQWLRTKTK